MPINYNESGLSYNAPENYNGLSAPAPSTPASLQGVGHATDVLGCLDSGYTAVILSKEGIVLGEVPISNVDWSRVLDDFSECTIRIPLSGPDCEPCSIIKDVNPWHHEIALFRDGRYVWSGPVVNVVGGRLEATIIARDLLQLMEKRIIHEYICFSAACGKATADLSVIGKAIIDDAFAVDGHNYEVQTWSMTGLLGERQYTPGEQALNEFQELLRQGLDATVLGRRIIIGSTPFGLTQTLTSDDFLVDLEYEIDGLNMATRAITFGEGVVGVAKAPGSADNGNTPYYGLLEYVSLDRQELNTQILANEGAQALIDALYPAPVTLSTPTGARLSPNAPVTIDELVPGVMIPVIATDLCRQVSGQFILIRLEVSWDQQTQEESVSITLAAPNLVNSGES